MLDAEVHQFGIFVTVIAPGLFRTAMAQQLQSFAIGADSRYAPVLTAMREQNAIGLDEAGDPDQVAGAIEDCILAGDPPARVVVGADALEMDTTVRQSTSDDLARLLRGFVASLQSEHRGYADPPP